MKGLVLLMYLVMVITALPIKHTNSTNVSLRHKLDTARESLLVTVTRKQEINDHGRKVAQSTTNLVYRFDLSPSRNLKDTIDGIPLKLYPKEQGKISAFATFLSDEDQDTLTTTKDDTFDNVEEDLFDAQVVLELYIKNFRRHATIRTQTLDTDLERFIKMEPVEATLPVDSEHGLLGQDEATIKQLALHYYRGNSYKVYGPVQEVCEYIYTVFVGFLSPFMILGSVLILIVVGVFACCDLTGTRSISLDDFDETSGYREKGPYAAKYLDLDVEKRILLENELS